MCDEIRAPSDTSPTEGTEILFEDLVHKFLTGF
jgi:hypothetical protein